MSGNSFNVIYVLICSGCLEKYIGETGCIQNKIKRQGQSVQTTHKTIRALKIKS